MTISIIRQATPKDRQRINAAARRFCDRHNIQIIVTDAETFGENLEELVDFHLRYGALIDPSQKPALQLQWARALCRALRVKYDRRIVVYFGRVGVRID